MPVASSPRVRPRRAKRRFPWAVMTAAGALALAAGIGFTAMSGGADNPASPPVETVAAPPPEAGPGEWRLPERSWAPLPLPDPASERYGAQVGALYAQPPPSLDECAAPSVPDTEAQWEAAVRDQWYCVHRAWAPTFQRLGWSTTAPPVHFFAGTGDDSACGYLEAPAFYCSAGEGSVHFGARHYAMARLWDLSVNEMVNHEYGHHLQHLSGITQSKLRMPHTAELERRAELQATCWSAAMTYRNAALRFGEAEYDAWVQRLETMQADGVHGSRVSLFRWGLRGLYATTMNDCNTWVVPASEVA